MLACTNYEPHYKVYPVFKDHVINQLPLSSCHIIKICHSQLFSFVHMFITLLFASVMCLHPIIDRKLSTLYDKYQNVSVDEFDHCDYVHSVSDVKPTDLVVMQLNKRGVSSKRSQLIDLVDNSVHNKHVDVVLISETWLTAHSPNLTIPGYELYRQDRVQKRVEE